ncbi:MAG: ATP-grasp domain-containing protein [Candidatus Woesearchaeota archaeon]
MKAAIISLGSESTKMIERAMNSYFDVVDLLDIRGIEVSVGAGAHGILYKGEPIEHYDCVFIRGSFKYATIQRAIASFLKGKCYMPYDPTAFTIVHDKLLTHLELEQHGIPMPKTYLTPTPKAAKSVLEQVNYPIIIKIPNGTQGKGVMFADSFASANSVLDTLTTLKQPFLIQEYIETDGSDIRAFVVGKKVIACMQRKSHGSDKRSNLHAGGEAVSIVPDERIKKIAIKTAEVLHADVCGVDILESPKGPLVIEANLSPGLQGITEVTKIDVGHIIAEHIAQKTTRFLEEQKEGNSLHKLLQDEGIEEKQEASFITQLDFRGERVLLPKIVSKEFKEEEEYVVTFDSTGATIKKE